MRSLVDVLVPRLGQKVRVADHVDDAGYWNDGEWFVVGLTTERGRPGVNVWIGPEYPLKTDGPTDGFYVNRWPKPDDLVWVDTLTAEQAKDAEIAERVEHAIELRRYLFGGEPLNANERNIVEGIRTAVLEALRTEGSRHE